MAASLQTARPIEHLSLTATFRSVRGLADLIASGLMTADPPYQRKSTWTPRQQAALVESWLAGTPIASVIINDRDNSGWIQHNGPLGDGPWYAVIDGKQRIEAGAAWLGGALAVPASWFPGADVDRTEQTSDGPYVRYPWLSKAARTHFAVSVGQLPVATAKVATVQAEAEIYLRVNSAGTAQTAEDLERAARVARGA